MAQGANTNGQSQPVYMTDDAGNSIGGTGANAQQMQITGPSGGIAVVSPSTADGSSANSNALFTSSRGFVFNGTTWDRARSIQDTGIAGVGVTAMATTPHTAAGGAIVPVVGAGVSSLVLKAAAGNFYSASMLAGATAGFLIAYNANAAPAGGAALTNALILYAAPVAANGSVSIGSNPIPDRFGTGIVLLFSTSTTTYTVPANLALHMRGAAV